MDDGLPCASFEPLNTPSPLKKKSRTYFSEKKASSQIHKMMLKFLLTSSRTYIKLGLTNII